MVTVLRIGHRRERDRRVTSHLILVARAFGASRIIIAGDEDSTLDHTIDKVVNQWGGEFKLDKRPFEDWNMILTEWKDSGGNIMHLTMYGENLLTFEQSESFHRLQKDPLQRTKLLIVVGGKKIPGKVFQLATWNIGVGNQPHSEVSALAVFLDHLMPHFLQQRFFGAQHQILPSLNGKKKYIEGNKDENQKSGTNRHYR
ncbi:MAG: tRNA (cytidine(56)-2'-O)-methyltransferase [Candidatus Thorarchaeota archaeon]